MADVTGIPSSVPGGADRPPIPVRTRWQDELQDRFNKQRALKEKVEEQSTLAKNAPPPATSAAGAGVRQWDADKKQWVYDVPIEKTATEGNASADAKYRELQTKKASGNPLTPDESNWIKGYEKQKLLVPATTANIRLEGIERSRQYQVYDHKTKQAIWVSAEELNSSKVKEPGRYTVASFTPEAIGIKKITEYMISGKGGQQLTAFNTAITHLDTLEHLSLALENSDYYQVNRISQEWQKQTGQPEIKSFDAAKNAMSGEVAAALKASGATDQEIATVVESFDRAYSEKGLIAAIQTYRELLESKANQLKAQYESGMQGKPAFKKETPETPKPGGNILKMEDLEKKLEAEGRL